MDAQTLAIGLGTGYVMGVNHLLECQVGVPYVYNKLLKWGVSVGGKPDGRQYFASVRFLHLKAPPDYTRLAHRLKDRGELFHARLGRSWVHRSSFTAAYDEGLRLLLEDPYALLREPPAFEFGELPFDGPTADMDGTVEKSNDQLEDMNWAGYYIFEDISIGGIDDELE